MLVKKPYRQMKIMRHLKNCVRKRLHSIAIKAKDVIEYFRYYLSTWSIPILSDEPTLMNFIILINQIKKTFSQDIFFFFRSPAKL